MSNQKWCWSDIMSAQVLLSARGQLCSSTSHPRLLQSPQLVLILLHNNPRSGLLCQQHRRDVVGSLRLERPLSWSTHITSGCTRLWPSYQWMHPLVVLLVYRQPQRFVPTVLKSAALLILYSPKPPINAALE